MIGHFFLFLTNNLCGLNRIGDVTHDSNYPTINLMVIIWIIVIITINTTNSPSITADNNISITVLMILQIISDTSFKEGFHPKIVENSLRLICKLLEILLLNSKANLKTIRFRSIGSIEKIKSRNTTLINRGNIGIFLAIVI